MKKIVMVVASEPLVEIHREPKLRPPRNDLRKLRTLPDPDLDETKKDPDLDGSDPDLSKE